MNQDYIDGLNTYYNLKLQYEDSINKMKKTIANNENLSWKEKRRAYKKMQPKCVQCHRSGGSIFQIKYDTNSKYREWLLQCVKVHLNVILVLKLV